MPQRKPLPVELNRVPQVAEYLNLSEKAVWAKIYAGEIEIIRIGRSVRISSEAIQEMIERGRVPARAC